MAFRHTSQRTKATSPSPIPLLATFQQKSLMIETLKIKLFGKQPVPKITESILEKIIERDFKGNSKEVKAKLEKVESDTESGKKRISASILKLANGNLKAVENFIEVANIDFRDVISQAEYPRCSKFGFEIVNEPGVWKIYLEDWKEYTEWLNK